MTKDKNKNSLKHGAFAEPVILPGEIAEDFYALYAQVIEEWNPEGPLEEDRVFSLTCNLWRKRRVKRYHVKKIMQLRNTEAAIGRAENRAYDKLDEVLGIIDLELPGSVTEENLSDKIGKDMADQIKSTVPRKNYESDTAWKEAVGDLICNTLEKNIVRKGDVQSIAEVMSHEVFANRELDLEERIDAKIDKDIVALGRMKTMKAMGIGKRRDADANELPKQIESPAIQAAVDP
jgi:hypothetical protein